MNNKWILNIIIVLLACMAAFFGMAHKDSAIAAGNGSEKVETALLDQINVNGSADFIIRFTDQADLSAAYSMDWNARGEFVYNTLREAAERSQVNAKAALDVKGLTYQTFIAGNELYVWGEIKSATKSANILNELTTLNELAAMPEVSSIRATQTYTIDPIVETKPLEKFSWAGDYLANNALTTVTDSTNATMDWGISDTKANQFWSTFGTKGHGIKVANIDTGVQWNHPALVNQFACPGDPSNPNCWYDPTGVCPGTACDNNGHGTHTMGTMVGDDNPSLPYIVGMAPDATWIACKGCESGNCSDSYLNACADWILAPGGNPANRPNVVNNSWGGGSGGNTWFQAKVNAWRAAGIFPAFSAGNTGSACGTLGSPGDYQESFGTAAHDINRNIASFSSRGPSTVFGDLPYTKPNLSAPGVNICSSVPSPSYWSCGYSGTSMASPHTAGAVALLWSCNPELVGQIDATFQLLQNSADAAPAGTCGAPSDGQGNYTFGYGYLDVLSAGKATCKKDYLVVSMAIRRTLNHIPTDIVLSNSTIMEEQPINTVVGTLSTTDPDVGNTFTYSLVAGAGDLDNASFNISGNQLRSSAIFDYATKSSYSIRIRTTDQGGLFFEKVFTITILPLSANPIVNGDFEQGPNVGWTEFSTHGWELILQVFPAGVTPYDGTWAVWLGGDFNETSYIQQQVLVPAANPYLSYWHWIASGELLCASDFGEVLVNGVPVEKYYLCQASNTSGWVKKVVDLSAYAGQSVTLQIRAECDAAVNSNLFIDHVSFQSTLTSENHPPQTTPTFDASISKTEILKK